MVFIKTIQVYQGRSLLDVFIVKVMFFLLKQVEYHLMQKALKKIYVSTDYFPLQNLKKVYLSISTQISIRLIFFKKVCKNNLKINSFVHVSVMHNTCFCMFCMFFIDFTLNMKIGEESTHVCEFEHMIFLEILTSVGLFSQFHGLTYLFSLQNARLTSDKFNKLKQEAHGPHPHLRN